MAGISKPTLRDLPSAPVENSSNPLSDYVDSLPDKRGLFDPKPLSPGDPQHLPLLQQLLDATVQGVLGEEQVKKLMNRNPSAAPLFANALNTQKLYKKKSGDIQSILSGSFQPEGNVISGPEDDQMVRYQQSNYDYQKAINRLTAMGETERADKLAEQWKRVQESSQGKQQGLYGGVQYAWDPSTKQYVPYSIDEKTRQAVPITPPPGTQPTVPMLPQATMGPGGTSQITLVPSRVAPGQTPQSTGTGLQPPGENLLDKQKQEIGDRVSKSGIGDSILAIERLNRKISQPGNLAGLGGFANLPGSQFFVGDEGRNNIADFQTVLNQIVLKNSGASTSEQEIARNLLAASRKPGFTEQNFRDAWPKILSIYSNMVGNIAAGHRPEAVSAYENEFRSRTGTGLFSNPLMNPGQKPPEPQPSVETKTIGGKTYVKQNGKWFEK